MVDSRSSKPEVPSGLMADQVLAQCLRGASYPGRGSPIILIYFIDTETEIWQSASFPRLSPSKGQDPLVPWSRLVWFL